LKESKKLDHLIFFFFNFTHKGRKYLTIIEHIFYFIIPFSCQNLSSIHAFVLHTNGLQVDADYIPELGFSSRDFGSKYHNLYSTTPCLMRPYFWTPFNGRYRQVWLYQQFFFEGILSIWLTVFSESSYGVCFLMRTTNLSFFFVKCKILIFSKKGLKVVKLLI
jgi:hypothetical protein